jgi:hypothetical protein
MDFNDYQFSDVEKMYGNMNIEFWRTRWQDASFNISNKFEYYRNNRPRFFIKALKQEGRLITFGANGIVNGSLGYLEEHINNNDFVFLEREKNDIWTSEKTKVRGIRDLKRRIKKYNLDVINVLFSTTGKVVLLGTHAFKSDDKIFKVLKMWQDIIEKPENINKTYSDMQFFVKCFMDVEDEMKEEFTRYTAIDERREGNSICDTHFLGNKIWFAKGDTKYSNKKYLNTLKKYQEIFDE